MKARTTTLLSLILLASLLIGAIAITALSAPQVLKLKVKWKPNHYVLYTSVPDPWNAEVLFAPARPLDDINASTILLEGTYAPSGPPYMSPNQPRLVIPFYGGDVLAAMLSKAGHLSTGEYRISLEITGELDDGTPFRGSKGIILIIDSGSPP